MTSTLVEQRSIKSTLKPRIKFYLDKNDPNYKLKLAIWVYFFLLIFEGALRKWILPGLASPLLLVRDPVAIYLIILAHQKKMMPASPYLYVMTFVGVISVFTAVLVGHGSITVALYGARALLLHFPVIFIIGSVFNRDDIILASKAMLWISIPMTILIILQFYSPQSAWVNRGIGGDESGGGFNGAMGFYRPPGTFSFTNGVTLFYQFLGPFVFYYWLYTKSVNRWLLVAATAGLLISVPLSLSRANFFGLLIVLAFTLLAVSRKPAYLTRVLGSTVAIFVVVFILSQLPIFQTSLEAFTARFEGANESEGGLKGVLVDRYFGGLLSIFTKYNDLPFFGYGLGLGTNLGAQQFHLTAIPEGEWGKIAWEQGLLLGLTVVFLRLGISFSMLIRSYQKLSVGDLLPWIMLSCLLLNLPQAQWKQPTSLGFSIIIAGFQMAVLKSPKKKIVS